jgi:hypothetical protein
VCDPEKLTADCLKQSAFFIRPFHGGRDDLLNLFLTRTRCLAAFGEGTTMKKGASFR